MSQIQGPYKKMAAGIEAELQAAKSQSDAVVAAKVGALATTVTALFAQLSHVGVPAAVQTEFGHLRSGTGATAAALKRLQAAAASHNASAAQSAAADLNQAFAEVASGLSGLKQKGLK